MDFEQHIAEMKALARRLTRYSFPVRSSEDEEDLACLKQREITIDGYDLIIHFNKCQYTELTMETLQLFGKYFSFLPFSLVCKIASSFLGKQCLSLVEVIHNKKVIIGNDCRKIYVWSVYYKDDKPIRSPFAGDEVCEYDGLEFCRIDRNQIAFF